MSNTDRGGSILLDISGGIATATLNRPEKLNAWDGPMRAELAAALKQFDDDPAVRAIILTGAGDKAFSAGQDLAETRVFTSGEAGAEWVHLWHEFYDVIRGIGKPLVAALNGVAAGSAFQVAMMTDIRVGHPGVRMGQPEINSGIPSTLGPWLMCERLGFSKAVELTLTGRLMEGQECHDVGLIHHLVPPDEVMPEARMVATDLGAKPPIAMRLNKQRFRALSEAAFEEACKAGEEIQRQAFSSGEPQTYMAKFFTEREKRKGA